MNSFPLNREFFSHNRQRLVEQLPVGSAVIIPAHTRLQQSGDVSYRFHQNTNFYYLTGIEVADCLLILVPGHPRQPLREILVTADSTGVRKLWEGQSSNKQLRAISGISNVIERRALERLIGSITRYARTVYLPRANGESTFEFVQNAAISKTEAWVRKKVGRKKLRDIRPVIAKLRMIKQPAEVDCIKQAISITNRAITKATRLMKPGQHEYELAATIQSEFLKAGATEAFPSIVAAGSNGCTIHYEGRYGQLAKDELVLLDVGAEYGLYAADISRTLPVSGRFSRRQRQVYEAVLRVKNHAQGLLKPGVNIIEYETQVREFMKQELVKLDLLKPNSPLKSVHHYFPHGTSHFLGLDVHDAGDYSQPLTAGMVMTVEPGIYIPEEGIAVRIEDDILITETGTQNLSFSGSI